jgi:anti-sigma factor RsiW
MIVSCDIIKDLLPLYIDDVCSDDSKAAVEEHLAACDNCKAELKAMQTALSVGGTAKNLKEAEAVRNLSKKWRKGMKKSLLKGIFITVLAIAAIMLALYLFLDIRIMY